MRYYIYLSILLCGLGVGIHAKPNGTPVDAQSVQAAVDELRKDPNLFSKKQTRALRWKDLDEKPPESKQDWQWLEDFFAALGEVGRVLMWVLGGLAAVAAAFAFKRWLAIRGTQPDKRTLVLPTHVGDLDIRPEHLPEDIGTAAWQLWRSAQDTIERRAALSLLYRGALSRLVHVHAVPVRASTTEEECIALAQAACMQHTSTIERAQAQFVTQLIQIWQKAVYGAHLPTDESVHGLCVEFGPILDARVQATGLSHEGVH